MMKLYYEVEGEGEPLILLGGYTCDLTHFDCIRKDLASSFQLILPDNRGAGRSGVPEEPFSIEQMADDILELIHTLGLKKPHLLGHSMGGFTAQSLAARFEKEMGKVIFYQTCLKIRPVSGAAMKHTLHLNEDKASIRAQAESILPWCFSNAFISDPKLCESFFDAMEKQLYPISLEGRKKQFKALIDFDSHSWYHKIRTPSLVLCGSDDLLCSKEDSHLLAKHIPGANLHVFPQMGHMAHIEQPTSFCSLVRQFLLSK